MTAERASSAAATGRVMPSAFRRGPNSRRTIRFRSVAAFFALAWLLAGLLLQAVPAHAADEPWRVAVAETGWPPFEYLDHRGEWSGLTADYLRLIAERQGRELETVVFRDWDAVLEAVETGDADVAGSFAQVEGRAEALNYTESYVDNPVVLVTRRDSEDLRRLEDLAGRSLAVERGHALDQLIPDAYPQIDLQRFADAEDALQAVATGEAEAWAGSLLVMAWVAERHGLANLQVRGPLPFATGSLRFVTGPEDAALRDTLDRELEAMDKTTHAELRRPWMADAVTAWGTGRLVELTDEERAWLGEHGAIRYAATPDWPPFDDLGPEGQHRGISADFLRHVAERTGLVFEHVPVDSWSEAVRLFRDGEVDLLTSVQRTPERDEFMDFTRPYLEIPLALVATVDGPSVGSLSDLAGRRVAVLADSGMLADLRREQPDAEIVERPSTDAVLRAVADGDAEVALDNLLVVAGPVRARYAGLLEVASTVDGADERLRLAVQPGEDRLREILDRGLDSVTPAEAAAIQQRWTTITIEEDIDWGRALRLAALVAGVALVILAIVLYFNRRLRRAYADLEAAQAQLVESEKMAALGSLVAGVAHEINTPLGVAMTTDSQLKSDLDTLQRRYSTGEMTRSDLERLLERAREGHDIVAWNLERAAGLVRDFKQVAVDRQRDERREFELRGFVDEVLHGLSPRLSRSGVEVENAIPEGVILDSWPGSLSQILTNLLINVEEHACPEGCRVWLRGRVLDDDRVEIECADEGRGMDAATCARVFEPFFTTRRSQGGSGLGLHIVWNQVTGRLGGSVRVESEPGQGARFILRLPRRGGPATN